MRQLVLVLGLAVASADFRKADPRNFEAWGEFVPFAQHVSLSVVEGNQAAGSREKHKLHQEDSGWVAMQPLRGRDPN